MTSRSRQDRGTQTDYSGASRPSPNILSRTLRWPVIPAMILSLWLIAAVFGPWISPHDPLSGDIVARNTPPAWSEGGDSRYLLGTDPIGRDILSRIIAAGRLEVAVVVVGVVAGLVGGTSLGLVAGYFGGIVDELIVRIVDMWSAVPFLIFAIVIVSAFGQSFGVLISLFILLSWTGALRLVRAEVLSLRTRDYVGLAKISGASSARIIYRHLLPNVMHIVIVTTTLQIASFMLVLSALSFLGLGVAPPNPSLGGMVSDGTDYIRDAWWTATFPGMALFSIVMAANFLGDWLRDRFDPRLQQLISI